MSIRPTVRFEDEWRDVAASWCRLWGVAGLERRGTLTVSRGLRSALGRCNPGRGDIRIASYLMAAPTSLIHEVLCHEIAHVAVEELDGRSVRPHGREWQALMRTAGFAPRVRLSIEDIGPWSERLRRARVLWKHHYPVCRVSRLAGRPVTRWHCAVCWKAGRDGRLVITRVPGSAGGPR